MAAARRAGDVSPTTDSRDEENAVARSRTEHATSARPAAAVVVLRLRFVDAELGCSDSAGRLRLDTRGAGHGISFMSSDLYTIS